MPPELTRAMIVDRLCRRYGCLPSQLEREDVSILMVAALAIIAEQHLAERGGDDG